MSKTKKIILLIIPVVIITIFTCLYIANKKEKYTEISTEPLGNSGRFSLGNYVLTRFDIMTNNTFAFVPKDKEIFLNSVLKFDNYLGEYKYPDYGSPNQEAYMFYYDGLVYALVKSNPGFGLAPCSSLFQSMLGDCDSYYYIVPGKWAPNGTSLSIYNDDFGSFDDFFGNFESAVTNFYGYISDDYVSFNTEKQTITLVTFNRDNLEVNKEHLVIIDFVNKTVTESYKKENV